MSRGTLITAFFVLLFLLHQDFWLRDDPALVLGILPASLAYHVGWTLLVALGWFLVTKFCWPRGLDDEHLGAKAAGRSAASGGGGSRLPSGPNAGGAAAPPSHPPANPDAESSPR